MISDPQRRNIPPLYRTAVRTRQAKPSRYRELRNRLVRHKWISIALALLLLVGVGAAVTSTFVAFQSYRAMSQRDLALARDGAHQLSSAKTLAGKLEKNPFDTVTRTQACQMFANAAADFGRIQSDLDGLPAGANLIPHYGPLVLAAQHLVPVAADISQAGIIGCKALTLVQARMANPLEKSGSGMTAQDLVALKSEIGQVTSLLADVASRVGQVQPTDLAFEPSLAVWIPELRAALPQLRTTFAAADTLLAAAPTLFGIGQPANFLIEQLDSTELRPGGGFIGTYGVATISGARFSNVWMTDVDLLDNPFVVSGKSIPYPAQYRWFPFSPESWSLRDSNLDADFPTAARYAESIYHTEGGTTSLQGVIAITPWLIKNALKITGPIVVPEYHETITAANLVDKIHYYQLGIHEGPDFIASPDGHSSLRKRFTSYLFEHFMDKMRQTFASHGSAFLQLFVQSIASKDVQVYVNSPAVEQLLEQHDMAAAIEAPSSDSLFVVDANIIANKSNDFMTYTVRDQITVDGTGAATHHMTLTYSWPYSAVSSQNDYGTTATYRDYLRVYVPPGSTLHTQSGWSPQGISTAFGRESLAGIFTLPYGDTTTISLTWTTPHAAVKDATGWHYTYLVQRQAGVIRSYDITVVLPNCASGSGASQSASATGKALAFSGAITHDLTFHQDKSCR